MTNKTMFINGESVEYLSFQAPCLGSCRHIDKASRSIWIHVYQDEWEKVKNNNMRNDNELARRGNNTIEIPTEFGLSRCDECVFGFAMNDKEHEQHLTMIFDTGKWEFQAALIE